ncbi:alpha/beta hydrolase [Neisseria perflava]|uniref:alpha/beta hydrolase n=1 Tax=Neisseria perflava TaxID=33053 RepID=UPI00209E7DBB|nr:alpha/beta hydrolase [Neisseria perflava]MCP1661035.1 putative alpha/beta hydrolase family esterase [Neisseria perflava]MCP1773035.1 putative alpha/beta hydrolase family esterase [Neisseria perflava]
MNMHDLEDLTLLLVRDADEPEMWMDRWAVSYPTVALVQVSRTQSIVDWQAAVQTAFAGIHGRQVAAVAHGAGVSALLAWLYQADILAQKRLCNLILVSPLLQAFPDDAVHTLQRARCPCRAALVVGESGDYPLEWAQEKARLWQARLLVSPHQGRLNGNLGGWQWGMKLMQEMLLSG